MPPPSAPAAPPPSGRPSVRPAPPSGRAPDHPDSAQPPGSGGWPADDRRTADREARTTREIAGSPRTPTETPIETLDGEGPVPGGAGPRVCAAQSAEDTRFELVRGLPQHAF